MTATPPASYRSGASEGVVGGDSIYAIKFVFKCHETAAIDTVLLSPRVAVAELVPLITGPINERFVKIVTIVKERDFIFFSLSLMCFVFHTNENGIEFCYLHLRNILSQLL